MGKTVPTYTRLVKEKKKKLEKYRDALRKRDRESFERILEDSQKHRDAGKEMTSPIPFRPMMLSVLLELEKRIEKLEEAMKEGDGDAESG